LGEVLHPDGRGIWELLNDLPWGFSWNYIEYCSIIPANDFDNVCFPGTAGNDFEHTCVWLLTHFLGRITVILFCEYEIENYLSTDVTCHEWLWSLPCSKEGELSGEACVWLTWVDVVWGAPEVKVEPSRRHQPGEEDVARAPAP
jgi:hypothetical protein